MSRIGFIGLGTMGRPMARNLLQAGHELWFFARRTEVNDQFRAEGAIPCNSCAEVAASADIIITIVTGDSDIEEVILGEQGVITGCAPNKILVDMSTISPETARAIGVRLNHLGVSMLDAPVSGGPSGANKGTLTIMVGGDEGVLGRTRTVLGALGDKIVHVGPLGAGQTVKLVNQMIAGSTMALIGEAFALGKSAGVDLNRLADVISASSGNSTIFAARGRNFVLADYYEPGFKTTLMRKDLGLAVDMASCLGVPTPLATAAFQQYTSAINLGYANADFASVAKVCAQAASITVPKTEPS